MADDHDAQLEREVNVLRAVPGVRCVSSSKYTGSDLNKMNVFFLVTPPAPGSSEMQVRTSCNRLLRDAKRKLELIVGDTVLQQAGRASACGAATCAGSVVAHAHGGACIKGWGGCGCAGAGCCAVTAAGCCDRDTGRSGCGRARAVLVGLARRFIL